MTAEKTVPEQRGDAPAGPAEDRSRTVANAFSLGWHLGDHFYALVDADRPAVASPPPATALPSSEWMDTSNRLRANAVRVRADLAALNVERRVLPIGLTAPDLANLLTDEQLTLVGPVKAAEMLRHLHLELLTTLMAVDPALGKAYDLGSSLAGFCGPRILRLDDFRPDAAELLRLHDLVRDLTSVLRPHAGHAVSTSMARWHAYLSQDLRRPLRRSDEDERRLFLLRQGHMWRALLAGEKDPKDDIGINQYIEAGLTALGRGRRELMKAVRTIWPVLGVLAVAAGAVLWLTVSATSGTAESTTALTTVVATLTAGWRAIKVPMGKAFDGIEERLRDAEIDFVIADAITCMPSDVSTRRVRVAAEKAAESLTLPAAAEALPA